MTAGATHNSLRPVFSLSDNAVVVCRTSCPIFIPLLGGFARLCPLGFDSLPHQQFKLSVDALALSEGFATWSQLAEVLPRHLPNPAPGEHVFRAHLIGWEIRR